MAESAQLTESAVPEEPAVPTTPVRRTIPPHLTRLAVRAGLAGGVEPSRIARIPGLAELNRDGIRIPTASAIRVWELIAGQAESGEAEAGAAAGRVLELWRPGSLGVWDYLFTATETLTEAMCAATCHFAALGDPSSRFLVAHDSDGLTEGLTVTWQSRYHDHPAYAVHTEFVLALLLAEASSGIGRPLVPERVRLNYPAPARNGRLAELFGTHRIEFGADLPSITFTEADAEKPLPRADPVLLAILDNHARTSVSAARPILGWLDRFHAALESALRTGDPPELGRVAHRLGLSARTLQRHLAEEGTSWRGEVAELRRRQVDRLLRETSLSVESIAARVGYSDPRALRRAVHRWYGHGPDRVRAMSTR